MKVAVVGCGWAGNRHARAYRAAGAEVGWAVDVDETRVVVDGRQQTIQLFSELPPYQLPDSLVAHEIRVPPADPFELEVRHFLSCVEDKTEPITSGRLQRRNLELVLAAYASMASGAVVSIRVGGDAR